MELCLTETQLRNLIKNTLKTKELGEQETPVNPEPKSGTSDKQKGGSGYPEVGKWESGVTRGPANQVGVTKWSDVVGANLKRSKANQLKEQIPDSRFARPEDNQALKSYYKKSDEDFEKFLQNIGWDEWGQWGLTIGSIAAAFFIPGAQGLGIAAGLDLIAAADQYFRQKDSVGAGVSTALAFVPFIGDVFKIGKIPNEKLAKLIERFGKLNTKEEVMKAIEVLPKGSRERYMIESIMKMGPREIASLINTMVSSGVKTQSEATRVVNNINNLYKSGKLKKEGVKNMFLRLGLRRFGFDITVSGAILYTGHKIQQQKNEKEILNISRRDPKERPARPEDFN